MRHVHTSTKNLLVTLAVAVLAATSLGLVSAGASTPTASTLLRTTLHDAALGRWVHESGTFRSKGAVAFTFTNIIGTTEGTQSVRFPDGATATNIDFPSEHRAYVYGNLKGLAGYMQMSAAAASKYANKWLEILPANPQYANVVNATTLGSDFSQTDLTNPTLGPITTLSGVRVRVINATEPTGSTPATAHVTLYVSLSAKPLPYKMVETAGTLQRTVSWSKWGQATVLHAPTVTVPYPG